MTNAEFVVFFPIAIVLDVVSLLLFAMELCNAMFLHHVNTRTTEEGDVKVKESRATVESHTCYETEASRFGNSAHRKMSRRSHWLSINSILVSHLFFVSPLRLSSPPRLTKADRSTSERTTTSQRNRSFISRSLDWHVYFSDWNRNRNSPCWTGRETFPLGMIFTRLERQRLTILRLHFFFLFNGLRMMWSRGKTFSGKWFWLSGYSPDHWEKDWSLPFLTTSMTFVSMSELEEQRQSGKEYERVSSPVIFFNHRCTTELTRAWNSSIIFQCWSHFLFLSPSDKLQVGSIISSHWHLRVHLRFDSRLCCFSHFLQSTETLSQCFVGSLWHHSL